MPGATRRVSPIKALNTALLLGGSFRTRIDALSVEDNRWDEKAGLRRDAVGSQVIDALEAQEIKETGNEKD